MLVCYNLAKTDCSKIILHSKFVVIIKSNSADLIHCENYQCKLALLS